MTVAEDIMCDSNTIISGKPNTTLYSIAISLCNDVQKNREYPPVAQEVCQPRKGRGGLKKLVLLCVKAYIYTPSTPQPGKVGNFFSENFGNASEATP